MGNQMNDKQSNQVSISQIIDSFDSDTGKIIKLVSRKDSTIASLLSDNVELQKQLEEEKLKVVELQKQLEVVS